MTIISVIVGSTRENRFSEKPAQWIFQHLKKRSHIKAQLLDLRDYSMGVTGLPRLSCSQRPINFFNKITI